MHRIVTNFKGSNLISDVVMISEEGIPSTIGIAEREFKSEKETESKILFHKIELKRDIVPDGCKTTLDGIFLKDLEWSANTLIEGVPFESKLVQCEVGSDQSRIEVYKKSDGFYQVKEVTSEGGLGIPSDKLKSLSDVESEIKAIKDVSEGVSYRLIPSRRENEQEAAVGL